MTHPPPPYYVNRIQCRAEGGHIVAPDKRERSLTQLWAKLKHTETILNQLIQNQSRPCLATVDGIIVAANRAFADLLGCADPADVIGTDGIAKYIAPLSQNVVRQHAARGVDCPYHAISQTPNPHRPYLVELHPHTITWHNCPARLIFVARTIDLIGESNGTVRLVPRPASRDP